MKTINCDDPTGIREVQEKAKRLVAEGKITKQEAIVAILDATIIMLESLKLPEDQTWEKNEYGYMVEQTN